MVAVDCPAGSIASTAIEKHAGLIVMGLFGDRLGWAGFLVGSAAILHSAALTDNALSVGLFATINAFALLAYFCGSLYCRSN